MIDASFGMRSKQAAIDGVYQYDTGQRLRLSGLPSPGVLSAEDDFLSGDLAAVQVHFGYLGDTQAEMRLAEWNEERKVWTVDLPDEYLTRSEQVNVYVYVSHGATENESRNRTMYTGVFTPISRPAPNNVATDDQIRIWNELKLEVDLVLTDIATATSNAQDVVLTADAATDNAYAASETAHDAYNEAMDAIYELDNVERRIGGLTVRAITLAEGAQATAVLDDNVLTYGIPRGKTGPQGAPGEDGPVDIELSMTDGVLTITPR